MFTLRPAPVLRPSWCGPLCRLLCGVALLLAVGCGSSRPTPPPPSAGQPAVYDVQLFNDAPVAPGYLPTPGADQVAWSAAGGQARRLDVRVRRMHPDRGLAGEKLLAWYVQTLQAMGWKHSELGHNSQIWHKPRVGGDADWLRVEIGGGERDAWLRLRMYTAPLPAQPPADAHAGASAPH